MTYYIGDVHELTTFDGKLLTFPYPEIKLIAYGNYGAPPTTYTTRRGYKQHGATEIDFLVDPRQIELHFWHAPACNRQAYWDTRLALHEILRPNRGGAMTLTLTQPGGEKRALIIRADSGFVFPPDDNNNWSIDETINCIAFDPIWFDPDQTNTDYALTQQVDTDLVFPITFPIVFGTSGVVFTTGSVTYPGTWPTYPVFTLTGPYNSVYMTNLQTGVVLTMVVAIVNGDTRIIDLKPGSQQILDEDGNSRFDELGPGSNLIDFAIQPDPIVAGGVQEIQVVMAGGIVGQSTARISYFNRYFAI